MVKKRIIKHDVSSLFRDLKGALLKDNELIFGYVFGSFGMNKSSLLSDVDVVLYVLPGKDGFEKNCHFLERLEISRCGTTQSSGRN